MQSMGKRTVSIRSLLLVFVAAVVLPLIALLANTIYHEAQRDIQEAKANVNTLARILAANTSRTLRTNQEALDVLARRPLMRQVDGNHCDPILADFRSLFPRFANLTTINLDGVAVCSAVPQPGGKPVNVFKAEWFQRALAEKRFLAGDPFMGPITGRMVSVLVTPIQDEQSTLKGFMGLPMDLALYDPNLTSAPMPEGTRYGIHSSSGHLIWRNVDPESLVGSNIGKLGITRQVLGVKNGNFDGLGTDGVHRLYAVAHIPEVDWYAYVGIPSQPIYQAAIRSAILNSAIGMVLVGVLTWLALHLAQHIARPTLELAETANQLREGRFDVRASEQGPKEVAIVAAEFNELVDALLSAERGLREANADLERRVAERTAELEGTNRNLAAEIARRIEAQTALQESEELFRAITMHNPDHLVVQDNELRYRFVMNPQLGLSEQEMLGKTDHDLLARDDAEKLTAVKRRILGAGKAEYVEASIVGKDGQVEYFAGTYTPKTDGNGKIDGLIGYFRNVTERKRADDEIARLNDELQQRARALEAANKELEAFAYSVSHDLRAPLRALDGYARILHEDEAANLGPDGKHMLERIWANAQKMGALIEDILHFSRISVAEMNWQETDMTALARDVAEELHGAYPSARVDIGELSMALGDKAMLRQVWANLIGNALKFSSKREQPQVEVGSEAQDGQTVYFVRDNGAGFDMAHAAKLFGVFQRMHAEKDFPGTGAGLSIVKRIVERHGGRIWAEAEVEKGAVFRFTLAA